MRSLGNIMQLAERLDLRRALQKTEPRRLTRARARACLPACLCACVFKSALIICKTTVASLFATSAHKSAPAAVSLQKLIIKINSIKGCNCCTESQTRSQTRLKEKQTSSMRRGHVCARAGACVFALILQKKYESLVSN